MQKKDSTKDGRATRIPAEPEIEQIIALLGAEGATQGQRDIINMTVRELSEETGTSLPRPDTDLRDFYLEAAYRIGAANARWRMREVLKLIAAGERFDDYKKGDTFYLWKDKRAQRNHSGTQEIAANLERRLSDPKTPDDYREGLRRSLREMCAAVGSQYNEKDPAWTYTEAQSESVSLNPRDGGDEWEAHFIARYNLLTLLEGLRKRRPLKSLEFRTVKGKSESGMAKRQRMQSPGLLYILTVDSDILNNLGLIAGEACDVYAADDLRPGDAAALKVRGYKFAMCGRVVFTDADQITLRNEDGEESVARADIITAGRIDHLNPWKIDPLTADERTRVNKLREKLNDVNDEDDQVIRCTERYRLEKLIFDIEHPVGGDPEDWNEWVGDE
jgi:hypothetical protein